MTTQRTPRELQDALDRLDKRIDVVAAAIADVGLTGRLTSLRGDPTIAAMMLRRQRART